jgi:RecA/RadA recombinase
VAPIYSDRYKDKGGFPIMVSKAAPLQILPTGLISLDTLLGLGGWPRRRVIMLHGKKESGKTTLALMACAQCQRAGGIAIYIDREAKLDLNWAAALGVDTANLVLVYPPTIESGFDAVTDIIELAEAGWMEEVEQEGKKSKIRVPGIKGPFVIVDDSVQRGVSAMRMKPGRKYDDKDMAWEAKSYTNCFKRFGVFLARHDVTYFAIDQVRTDFSGFHPVEKHGVGNEILHASAVVLDFEYSQSSYIKAAKGTGHIGKRVRVRVVHQQSTSRRGSTFYTEIFGHGPHAGAALHEAALATGVATPFMYRNKPVKDKWTATVSDGTVLAWEGWEGMLAISEEQPVQWALLEQDVRASIGTFTGEGIAVEAAPEGDDAEPNYTMPVAEEPGVEREGAGGQE